MKDEPAPRIRPFARADRFTGIDNYVLDYIMPELSANTWKVLCFIMRQTRGWIDQQTGERVQARQLSYSDIIAGTGIKGRATVSKALKELVSREYITVNGHGDWEAAEYGLNTALEVENPSSKTELHPSSIVEPPSSEIEPQSSSEIEPLPDSPSSKTEHIRKRKSTDTEKEKTDKEKGSPTHQQQLFQSICDALGWDHQVLSERQRGQVAQLGGKLSRANPPYSAVDVTEFSAWWFVNDWRGKKGDYPTYKQLGEQIGVWRNKQKATTPGILQLKPRLPEDERRALVHKLREEAKSKQEARHEQASA